MLHKCRSGVALDSLANAEPRLMIKNWSNLNLAGPSSDADPSPGSTQHGPPAGITQLVPLFNSTTATDPGPSALNTQMSSLGPTSASQGATTHGLAGNRTRQQRPSRLRDSNNVLNGSYRGGNQVHPLHVNAAAVNSNGGTSGGSKGTETPTGMVDRSVRRGSHYKEPSGRNSINASTHGGVPVPAPSSLPPFGTGDASTHGVWTPQSAPNAAARASKSSRRGSTRASNQFAHTVVQINDTRPTTAYGYVDVEVEERGKPQSCLGAVWLALRKNKSGSALHGKSHHGGSGGRKGMKLSPSYEDLQAAASGHGPKPPPLVDENLRRVHGGEGFLHAHAQAKNAAPQVTVATFPVPPPVNVHRMPSGPGESPPPTGLYNADPSVRHVGVSTVKGQCNYYTRERDLSELV